MAEAVKQTETKKTEKGGRKGGTLFPKINLGQSLDYAKKLVSKTHTGPQPEKTILPGVLGNAGSVGRIRASALKQFGLLEGTPAAYKATQLAREIDAALPDDRPSLLQRTFFSSKLFKQLFDIFHGDTVSKSKIEQRAKGLDVHPESAEECAQLFVDSAITACLGTLEGDSLTLTNAGAIAPAAEPDTGDDEEPENQEPAGEINEEQNVPDKKNGSGRGSQTPPPHGAKPGLTVNLTVDPSSDPDKLEKQLKLLRQYGVI
jgi:hypothetical protein